MMAIMFAFAGLFFGIQWTKVPHSWMISSHLLDESSASLDGISRRIHSSAD